MEKLLEQIAFKNINPELNDEHNCFLVNLLLHELYYYSKEQNKEIELNENIEEIFLLIEKMYNQLIRNTDMWDGLYVIHVLNNGTDSKYSEYHNKLFTELGGKNREISELSYIYRLAMMKVGTYLKGVK